MTSFLPSQYNSSTFLWQSLSWKCTEKWILGNALAILSSATLEGGSADSKLPTGHSKGKTQSPWVIVSVPL